MKFSFIVPAYNEEKYIEVCIKSILELDGLGDSELIIVDNGSEDNTAKIVIDKFPQVKLIRETRRGTGWAREAGFRASSGEFLACVDADVILPKDWIKKAENLLQDYPKGVAYSGPYDFEVRGYKKVLIDFYYIFFMVFLGRIFNFLRIGGFLLGGNMIIRADALKKIGGFDTHIIYWGDETLLAKRLRKLGSIYFLNSFRARSFTRRLIGSEIISLGILHVFNAIWVMLFNKPFNKTYKAIR